MSLCLQDSVFIFTDLDDTLFQTWRKCPPSVGALSMAATDRSGQPLSYFTPQQRNLMRVLERGTVIPVTGRNTPALERVRLEFSSYRVTSHGAMLLGPDGKPDGAWWALIKAEYEHWRQPMRTLLQWLSHTIAREALALRCRLVEDQGVPVYLSIKGDAPVIVEMVQRCRSNPCADGLLVHHNGQNMALLPPFASKERAVGFIMERLQESVVDPLFIGVGDSATDLPFLRRCHYALMPRESQIQESAWP
jgi:hypothetical protein